MRWCHGVSHLNCCCWRHQWERGRRSHVIQENSKENVIICQLQTNVECILYAFYVESCKHTNIPICNMIELLAAPRVGDWKKLSIILKNQPRWGDIGGTRWWWWMSGGSWPCIRSAPVNWCHSSDQLRDAWADQLIILPFVNLSITLKMQICTNKIYRYGI